MSTKNSDSILIEALADKFRRSWEAGSRPRLEDYVNEVSTGAQSALLGELLNIEIDCRMRLEEFPSKAEYLHRFAPFQDVVQNRFDQKLPPDSPTISFKKSDEFWERLGPYELIEPLGRGGMGSVYKAKHGRLKKIVALKVVNAEKQSPESLTRFQHEMEVVGRLNHPNIVQATDAGEASGVHYLVMEFVQGITALKLIKMHKVLPIDVSCHIIRQVAAGLAHIHRHGLVHRDMKPSNIMVTVTGQVKILDLGLARLNDSFTAHDPLTQAGDLLGTIDYMSPEQCEDAQNVDIRADIYGLGCTLFHFLTGRPPYYDEKSNTVIKKLMAHARSPIPRD